MNITPISNRVNSSSLKALTPQAQKRKNKKNDGDVNATINFENEVYINTHNSKLFRVRYNLKVTIEFSVEINIEYDFDFESDENVDTSIPRSLIVRSEIPAYSYPYMKSYIENILVMSGYDRFPLPYIDFLKNPMPEGKNIQVED